MQYLLPYDNNGDNTYKLSLPSLFSMEITNGLWPVPASAHQQLTSVDKKEKQHYSRILSSLLHQAVLIF